MRGEHVLDGQVEQGTQTLDDLLPRHVRAQPAGMILSPLPKFTSVSPATTVRWLSTQSTVSFGFLPGNVARLLGGEAELPHEVFGGIEQRRIDGCAEPLDQALRVALVPRRGEHDRRVAAPRQALGLARHAERVEEKQTVAVLDRIRGDVPIPWLA